MTAQGVPPTPEEYVGVFKGWAMAGELRERVVDGSVDTFFGELSDLAFELSPTPEVSSATEALSERRARASGV